MKLDPLPELVCREVVELLTEYLSEALPAEDRARLEAHLDDCEPCSVHLEQLKAGIELLGELRQPAAGDVSPRLLELFRGVKKR
jgi:anti-sigma factor RsiW